MKPHFGYFLFISSFLCLTSVQANSDVDGTIVWTDSDKKEKEITLGKPETLDDVGLNYWKIADDRIDDVDNADASAGKKANQMQMFLGNEETPVPGKAKEKKVDSQTSDTVDASFVTASDDADEEGDEDVEEDSIDDSNHQHEGNIVNRRHSYGVDEDADSSLQRNGDFASVRNLHGDNYNDHNNHDLADVESFVNGNDRTISERGEVKDSIRKHRDENKSLSSKKKKDANDLLYSKVNVKKDQGVGETENDDFDPATLNSFASDDSDVNGIIQKYANSKIRGDHRMGKDELQMHLDDEALKMDVKAIEEEDSNVRNVLQGAERFANIQKLGNFEGEYEKDLIKNIGDHGMKLQDNTEARDDDDSNRPQGRERDYNRKEDIEKGRENDYDKKEDEREDADELESNKKFKDVTGKRKQTITTAVEVKQSHLKKPKKYHMFGLSSKNVGIIANDDDLNVQFDNEAMESEIKAIQGEDVKVKNALEGNHNIPKMVSRRMHRHHQHEGRRKQKIASASNDKSTKSTKDKPDVNVGESNGLKMPDEISRILQETSFMLNETNAILNEGISGRNKLALDANANTTNDTAAHKVNELNVTHESTTKVNETNEKNNQSYVKEDEQATGSNSSVSLNSSALHQRRNTTSEAPAKRDLRTEDAPSFSKLTSHRGNRRNGHAGHKSEKTKHSQRNVSKNRKKYTKSELKILTKMYQSPVFQSFSRKTKVSRKHSLDKRFAVPMVKGVFKASRKHGRRSVSRKGHKRGFGRSFDRRKLVVRKGREETGKKRENVQEGMTGAISYTNRDGNEFMFAVSRDTLTWGEASGKCRSLGGELTSIGDKEEQEFIQANVIPESSNYWIGFTDQENEGTWQWTDKTPVRFTNWSNLEPDDGNIKNGQATHNEDCAVITPTMDWSDLPCWNRFHFICKFFPDNGRAISFGGTMSNSDVGNKKYDHFAEGLKNKNQPKLPTKKPVKEGNPSTRQKGDIVMNKRYGGGTNKGYSGQGPSRGGYKAEESVKPFTKGTSSMSKGKEAGVKGGAAAVSAAHKNALAQATANSGAIGKPVKTPVASLNKGSMRKGMNPPEVGTGVTGLGAIPGVTSAAINGNNGLAKIGGVGGAAPSVVQKGGNGGQSAINLTPHAGNNQVVTQSGNGGGGTSVAGGPSLQSATQGGGLSTGANGGAPGHVSSPAGNVQTQNAGNVMSGPGGNMQGSNNMAPASGPAGATGGGGGTIGGAAASGGGGGIQQPAGVPSLQNAGISNGGSMPSGNTAANGNGGQGIAGGGGGNGFNLTPQQAIVARELANQLAPKLAEEYASKFEPDLEMMQSICGKLCSSTALTLPNENPSKIGKSCGTICAKALMEMDPQEVMGIIAGMRPGGGGASLPQTMGGGGLPGGGIPTSLPLNNNGLGGGANGGMLNNGGGGSSSGGSNNGGTGGSNSNSNGGNGNNGGWSSGGDGNGGLNNMQGMNLQNLGVNLAPQLGLNIEGNGKITMADGQSLNSKVDEAINTIKNGNNLKTNAVSKTITPGSRGDVLHKKERKRKIKGFFVLKRTDDGISSSAKIHKYGGKKEKLKHGTTAVGSKRELQNKRKPKKVKRRKKKF